MIDTVELLYAFSRTEAQILLDMMTITVDKQKVEKFLDADQSFHFLPVPKRECLDAISPGILKLSFSHDDVGNYYLRIVLQLEALLENKRTNRLYRADARNNELLRDVYARSIFKLFPNLHKYKNKYSPRPVCDSVESKQFKADIDKMNRMIKELEGIDEQEESKDDFEEFLKSCNFFGKEEAYTIGNIPYLWLAHVKKIDYSVNIWVEDKSKYLRYVKKTFYTGGRVKMRSFKGNNNVYASNNSRSVLLYDKALKYENVGCTDEALVNEAKNIVRYEVRIKPTKDWIIKNCGLNVANIDSNDTLCGLLPLLNEEVAHNVLCQNYEEHIGLGTWVSKYHFNKKVAYSKYGKETKGKLKRFGELVGQSKSVRFALEQFISGKTIGKAPTKYSVLKGVDVNNQNAVKQRKKQFRDYITKIRALGIQPMRLTDKDGSELTNPFADGNFTLQGYWFCISNDDDSSYIVDVPVGVLPRIQHLATNLEIEKIHAKHVEKAVKDEEER